MPIHVSKTAQDIFPLLRQKFPVMKFKIHRLSLSHFFASHFANFSAKMCSHVSYQFYIQFNMYWFLRTSPLQKAVKSPLRIKIWIWNEKGERGRLFTCRFWLVHHWQPLSFSTEIEQLKLNDGTPHHRSIILAYKLRVHSQNHHQNTEYWW